MTITKSITILNRTLTSFLLVLIGSASVALAQAPRNAPTARQIQEMVDHNENALLGLDFKSLSVNKNDEILPYAEYNEAGYLIFSSEEDFGSSHIKEALVRNLPQGVTLIVYTDKYNVNSLYNKLQSYNVNKNEIRILKIDDSYRGFWARDAVPVPVWKKSSILPNTDFQFGVVDAKYYHYFEPDKFFNKYFNSTMTSYDFYYEGGNFIASSKGDCLIVNKTQTKTIPDGIFLKHYGCKNLTRLPHVTGIGHADEVVKFVSDDHVFTDQPSYVSTLEAKGYKVTMLPNPASGSWGGETYETYVNSLILNGTVFVPIFGKSTDQEAIDTYKSLGLKVVPLNSSSLSNDGAGSIHCITMTYPTGISYDVLATTLDGKDVTPGNNVATPTPSSTEQPEQQEVQEEGSGGSWLDWMWSESRKAKGSVKLTHAQQSMPVEDYEGLETYERPVDENDVGGFLEPDPNESESEDSIVLF